MTLFMSTEGPDLPPLPEAIDVRYWGSTLEWDAARKLQSKVDKIAPRGTRTYIAHSLVRKDFRKWAALFGTGVKMPRLPYLVVYITDPEAKNAESFADALNARRLGLNPDDYERIAFEVYSAPPPPEADPGHSGNLGNHWHHVCDTVTEILLHSSSSPPGGQA